MALHFMQFYEYFVNLMFDKIKIQVFYHFFFNFQMQIFNFAHDFNSFIDLSCLLLSLYLSK